MTHFSWWLDGSIIGFYLLATMVAGLMVRKYVGKVEHYLVAGRELNLYLGIASLAATEFGLVTCMYAAQNGYDKGFAGVVPGILMALSMYLVGVTGFCIKPLRKAGVVTIPELFERRYGSFIRWMSGVVIMLGGLLNMGIILRAGGDFLVLVTGLNDKYLEIVMTLCLIFMATYTILGGMLSVLVTDYLQFIMVSVGMIVVTVLILARVGWSTLVHAVEVKHGIGGFNPFLNASMGWPYVAFNTLLNLSVVLCWQTTITRLLSAKDTKTGQKIYTGTSFFFVCRFLIPGVWGIAALAWLKPGVVSGDTTSAMPIMLGQLLPVGIMGILLAAMLAAEMSSGSSYMLTWASVIYNDVLGPFRKKRHLTEKRGLLWNRMIVSCIGIYLLIFGIWYTPKFDLWTYMTITGSIYLSSMSVLLIACCYWKRANSWGAGAAIIIGAFIPIFFLVMQYWSPSTKALTDKIGPYYSGIATYMLTGLAMITGSLLKPSLSRA